MSNNQSKNSLKTEQTILISGAGSGIGRALAQVLAAAGHRIVLLGRNEQTLAETRATLPSPDKHAIITADIRDAAAIRAGLAALKPVLHGVVANAGVGGENHYGDGDRWEEILSTNLTGSYQLVQEALPYFGPPESGFRQIVLISSILARLGVPGYSAYCASKAGLLGLMRVWAAELAPQKILVNAICPGWVQTEMATQGLETFALSSGQSYEAVYQEQMAQVPLGKMSEPAEIAQLVAFLLSGQQQSITGQTFDINNGAIMPA
ncbi:MAG: SDR family oxidoreductase [Anaerolineales bacterium]|nr:SDR family oxidoreductase [Anaerolineales bacterium]